LVVIEQGQCRFLSRKKHKLTGHQDLSSGIGARGECGVLDGELVVVDHPGRSVFADMVQRRNPAPILRLRSALAQRGGLDAPAIPGERKN